MNRVYAYIIALVAILISFVVVLLVRRPTLTTGSPINITPQQVSSEAITQPVISVYGDVVSYLFPGRKGGLAQLSLTSGQVVRSYTLPGISSVSWSKDGRNAVVWVYQDRQLLTELASPFLLPNAQEGQLTVWLIDMENGRPERLSDYIQAVTWDDTHKVMYYHYQDLVSSADGVSELRRLDVRTKKEDILGTVPMGAAYKLEFIDKDTILMVPEVTDPKGMTGVYVFSIRNQKITPYLVGKAKFVSGWQGSTKIIYARAKKDPTWHIFDLKTNQDINTGLKSEGTYAFWISNDRFIVGKAGSSGQDLWTLLDLATNTQHRLVFVNDIPFEVSTAYMAHGTLFFTSHNTLYKVVIP